jgi:glycosyltransferase involved in cell wall biosynthesis
MIVKNEAHIVHEALDSVAPHISSWVIVDTGSDDGTQDVIRMHMAGLGIPGEIHERPWENFGHNRTEALALAQGHGDYIWVVDADDTVTGTPDFTQLRADVYSLRRRLGTTVYWRAELFRDGVRAHWVGATHEYATWDHHYISSRLEGEYQIDDRQLSSRNKSGEKFSRDRDLLLEELERNPDSKRSMFYLAQSYFDLGDFVNARKWYARRAEMGGWAEEVYFSLYRVAESMAKLDEPWPEILDAYLKAWEIRPMNAEPLHAIAHRHRLNKDFGLGYLFAERAAQMEVPQNSALFVRTDVYGWRAVDEQALCAFRINKQTEAFTLWRGLLARTDLPDDDRERIARNRDYAVPAMLKAATPYPETLAHNLIPDPPDTDITATLITGPNRQSTEHTLNTFLHCCTDITTIGRFLAIDTGLSPHDRTTLHQLYPFLEFTPPNPATTADQIRDHIHTRFWLHLGHGWQFFAPDNLITRLTAVLNTEPHIAQVALNYTDATDLTGTSAPQHSVRHTPEAGRYVLTDTIATGPAMYDTTRLDHTNAHTATLDETHCTKTELTSLLQQTARSVQVGVSAAPDSAEREKRATRDSVIFICGAQRSGNTLMRAMLDSHPRICSGQELKVLPHIAHLYQQITGPYDFVLENYGNSLSDVQGLFRQLIDGLTEKFRRAEGKQRWAEKTPQNVQYMVTLGEIFPEAQFIHMLRDGRDVACSLVTMNWSRPETGLRLEFTRTMSNAATHWRDTVITARRQSEHPSLAGRVLEVRYEALVTETDAIMHRVLGFLGEEWNDAVLSHHTRDRSHDREQRNPGMEGILRPVDESAVGRWQRDMTEHDKAAFKAQAGQLLTELGYADADW